VLSIQKAAESFHDEWQARLGRKIKAGVVKEHWTRVKALCMRLATGMADGYDNLQPVADLHKMLQRQIYVALQSPSRWLPQRPSDEDQDTKIEEVTNAISGCVMDIARRRLQVEPISSWQKAYAPAGRGSSFVRAHIIDEEIYEHAAPIPDATHLPARNAFLREVLEAIESAAEKRGAVLR